MGIPLNSLESDETRLIVAAEELAGRIGQTAEACEALGVARCTLLSQVCQLGHAQT